jgi:hypothetical protein
MKIKCMSTREGKHIRAPKPSIIQCQQRESTVQDYEHAHSHRCRAAPSHERWHDSHCKAQHEPPGYFRAPKKCWDFPTQEAYGRWAAPMARSINVGDPNAFVFRYRGHQKTSELRMDVNCVKTPKYTRSKQLKLLGALGAAGKQVMNIRCTCTLRTAHAQSALLHMLLIVRCWPDVRFS